MVLSPKVLKPLKPMYTKDVRYIILYGGRGGAKSFGCSQYMLLKSFNDKVKGLILRQTLAVTDESVKAQITGVAETMKIDNLFESTAKSTTNIQTGNRLAFMGFQTSSKLQSAKMKSLTDFTHVWIEEADEVKEEDFDKLDASIRKAKCELRIILSFNTPHTKHWLKNKFFQPNGQPQDRDDVLYIKTTYLDLEDGMVSDSFLALAERVKEENPEKYEHTYLGEWQDETKDQIYRGWTSQEKFPEELPFLVGLDFGFNHPTAIVKTAYQPPYLYVEELLYQTDLLPSDRIAFAKELGDVTIIADSANAEAIAEMRVNNIRVLDAIKGPGSVLKGIEDIQDLSVVVCGDSPNIWNEYYEYKWAAPKVPMKKHDDAMDAIRYTLRYLKRGIKKKRYAVA